MGLFKIKTEEFLKACKDNEYLKDLFNRCLKDIIIKSRNCCSHHCCFILREVVAEPSIIDDMIDKNPFNHIICDSNITLVAASHVSSIANDLVHKITFIDIWELKREGKYALHR